MIMENCVPNLPVKATLRLLDDAVVLTSDDPLLEDWEGVLPQGSLADLKLRKALEPKSEGRSILELVEEFLASGASSSTYPSGLTLSATEFSGSTSVIPIGRHTKGASPVHYGLSLRGVGIMSVEGENGSGRTLFTRRFLPDGITSFIDLAKIDFDSLSPSARKEYGHSIALSFQRNPNLRYLVLDHYSQENSAKRKHHPAFYHDIMGQIMGDVSIFEELGKTLVLAESHPFQSASRVVQMSGAGDYGFRIDGIDFPALLPTRPRRPHLAS